MVDEEFVAVAERSLTAVASSAVVERILSTFGYIHSNIRNRLAIEKAAKLVFIYLNKTPIIFLHYYILFLLNLNYV